MAAFQGSLMHFNSEPAVRIHSQYGSTDQVPPAIRRAFDAIITALAGKLSGLYLFGSAVSGGLRPNSDLDFLAVLSEPLEEKNRDELVRILLPVSGSSATASLARPIELTAVTWSNMVPWRYPPRSEFVYGEWLRAEFESGRIAPPGPDPDLAIVLATVLASSINLVGPPAKTLFDPVPFEDIRKAIAQSIAGLVQGLVGDERNVVLTLARMWTTLTTREIVPKDVAAARMLQHIPAEHGRTLDLARRAYLGQVKDDWSMRQAQANPFVEYSVQALQRLLTESIEPGHHILFATRTDAS
jgi:aminoglycoside 9-adenylyltransferase